MMYIPFSLRATGECAKHWVSSRSKPVQEVVMGRIGPMAYQGIKYLSFLE